MAVVSMIVFVVIFQQCSAVVGEATVNQTKMQIIEGSDVCANTGDELTLNCVVFAPIPSNRTGVKWSFKNNIQAVCDNLKDRIGDGSNTTCNLTIKVGPAAEGVYMCRLITPDADRPMNVNKTVELKVNNCDHQSTLQLLDPSTGAVLNEPEYGPVCVQSGTTRRFECKLLGARRAQVWTFKWILGTQTIAAESEARTTGDGLVSVSSWQVVKNPGNGTRESNLTCRAATNSGGSLDATVLITFCRDFADAVVGVQVSICVTATIATIICHILMYTHYTSKRTIVRG